jgi:DnaK suppressor protein
MDVEIYRRRLLTLQASRSSRIRRDIGHGRAQVVDSPADAGDAAVTDEAESEDFTEAELDAEILQQIHEALRRIAEGSYGRCLVDGGPIEKERLDAVPWAAYCIEHQRLLESASRPRPTL